MAPGIHGACRRLCLVTVPFACLPVKLLISGKAGWCAYCMLWMSLFWVLEPIPLPVTALLPLVLFPLLGILGTDKTTEAYFNNYGFIMFTSLILAVAIEASNVHRRIALKLLLLLGASTRALCLMFMLVAMAMSMWIPNTTATAVMTPIVLGVVDQIQESAIVVCRHSALQHEVVSITANELDMSIRRDSLRGFPEEVVVGIKKVMLLAVAYATNIGGTGTMIGSGPNLILKGFLERQFPEAQEVTFTSWMLYNVPPMLLCVLLGWLYIQSLLLSVVASSFFLGSSKTDAATDERIHVSLHDEILRRYLDLGRLTFQEATVLCIFIVLVMSWSITETIRVPGDIDIITPKSVVGPSVPLLAAVILLFGIPKDPANLRESPSILTWDDVTFRMRWGVVLLISAGVAIAHASEHSGFSVLMIDNLKPLTHQHPVLLVTTLCLFASFFTEITSNAAVASIMMPVILQMSIDQNLHPLYLAMPVTIACSFSFMLPTATASNAIVFAVAKLRVHDMVRPGFVMNTICVLVELATIHVLGPVIFDTNHVPQWAMVGHRANLSLLPALMIK